MITIGQKLYRRISGRYIETTIQEYTVSKINRKYFKVAENSRYNFDIESLRYDSPTYSQADIQLYLTSDEIELEDEMRELHFFCKDKIAKNKLTLNQLREIKKIIEP